MTLFDYRASREIDALGDQVSFYAIVMAAMRRADDQNLALLVRAWPQVYAELRERYDAPHGGLLRGEKDQGDGWIRREDGVLVDAEGVEIFWPEQAPDEDPADPMDARG